MFVRRPLLETPTLTAGGAVVGRPRKLAPAYRAWPIRQEPPENVQDFIRERAAAGDVLTLIAHALGTSDEVLRRWMDADPNLRWAYRVGMAEDERKWVNLLKRDAFEAERGNVNDLAYLNRRHGWRNDAPDSGTRVAVMINLPGSRPLSDYIEVTSNNADGTQHHGLPAPLP